MSSDAGTPRVPEGADEKPCPDCGARLASEAVLCIECGYDFNLGRRLETVIERAPPPPRDDNPYAPPVPAYDDETPRLREATVFDLTDYGAQQASAIVSDAESVLFVILLAWCICAPAWFVMLPWYAYRLHGWHRLNQTFAELRTPNSFSPHGDLAARFQDARRRLWIGIVAGLVFWALVGIAVVLNSAARWDESFDSARAIRHPNCARYNRWWAVGR